MSKAAIYDQLTSEYGEQFTEQAAQYAMENLQADWNANALACAASYSENMHLSKAAIYDQLTSEYGEQFTAEEARYAVDNLEADYRENAPCKRQNRIRKTWPCPPAPFTTGSLLSTASSSPRKKPSTPSIIWHDKSGPLNQRAAFVTGRTYFQPRLPS